MRARALLSLSLSLCFQRAMALPILALPLMLFSATVILAAQASFDQQDAAAYSVCNADSIALRTHFTGEGYQIGGNVVPVYNVTIENTMCSVARCLPSNVHLHCGAAVQSISKKPLDPQLFRMVSSDDCLVNDGRPLPFNTPIAFEYASLVEFTLSFKSATFCP